jgi:hypothetical protein
MLPPRDPGSGIRDPETRGQPLLSALVEKALRATDVQFLSLNDGEELVYAAREISARLSLRFDRRGR